MRYIGLDLGSKTLGIAISDMTKTIAGTYKTLRHDEEYDRLVDEVKKIVEEEKIEKIILGLPKNMNNTIGFKGELSYKFKSMLEEKISCEVVLVDERLTTVEVEKMLIRNDTSRNKRKKVVDSLAATLILQTYLDSQKK